MHSRSHHLATVGFKRGLHREEVRSLDRPPGQAARRRVMILCAALLSVALVTVLSVCGFRARSSGHANYVISDVRLSDPPGGRPGTVMVRYKIGWTDEFPGEHRCETRVLDAAGNLIGSRVIIEHLLPQRNQSGGTMDVDGEAARAEVKCDPDRLDTAAAYVISDERIAGPFAWQGHPSPAGVYVSYRLSWPVEAPEYPGTNGCTVKTFGPTGTVIAEQRFTLFGPEGKGRIRLWRADFSDWSAVAGGVGSLTADIECHPYGSSDVP
jgi:hypothetical protein